MKVIAYVLPQFHRIPENDKWWGDGFTEWTNTRKSPPLFTGHYQPREPYNDFYYDLTDPDVRKWQAEIAQKHGVYGFCYYHYWFSGKTLLEKPVNEIVELGEPEFPFCLCWANHTWNRSWTHEEQKVLMLQTYGDESEWKLHFDYLLSAFQDSRYIKVDNKPMFVIYRPKDIPRCEERLKYWNELAWLNGFDGMYFVETLNCNDPMEGCGIGGFDAAVEFEPLYTIKYPIRNPLHYDTLWQDILNRSRPEGKTYFLGAFPGWDNTARKQEEATIVIGSTPKKFGYYTAMQIEKAKTIPGSDFLFINAWNEWAEGAYLEPDKRFGLQYLEYLSKAVHGEIELENNNQVAINEEDLKIMELVDPESEIILHVGCGSGRLGKAIKGKSKTVVYGITESDSQVQEAADNLDFVLCGDWKVIELPFAENTFDAIVLDGVFETSVDTESVLKKFSPYLKQNGKIIASIYNIGHISIISNLLNEGKWQYSHNGVLNKKHIRFFTLKEIETLVKSLGLVISGVQKTILPFTPEQQKTFEYLKQNRENLDIQNEHFFEELAIEKYIIEVTTPEKLFTEKASELDVAKELAQYKITVKENIKSLIDKGMLGEAHALIRDYESIINDDVEMYSFQAVIAIMEDRLDNAVQILQKGLAIEPQNFDLCYNLAFAYRKLGNLQDALSYFQKALAVAPKEALKYQVNEIIREIAAKDISQEAHQTDSDMVDEQQAEMVSRWFDSKDGLIEAQNFIAESRESLTKFVEKAEAAFMDGNCEGATIWAQKAADFAFWHHPAVYSSAELETVLLKCARELDARYEINIKDIPEKNPAKRSVLHVLSQGYSIGGHTKLVKQWIQTDTDNTLHSIAVTLNGESTPEWLIEAARNSGGWYYRLDQDNLNLCQRAKVLRAIAYSWADVVVVHAHPHDPIPVLSFGIDGGPPIIFMNHADHGFWLGVSVADTVANIRKSGELITLNQRGAKHSEYLPIPLSVPQRVIAKEEAKRRLGIDCDKIVLLSVASAYKYSACGQLDFLQSLKNIVLRNPQVIALVIGPIDEGRWQQLRFATGGRVRALGIQSDVSLYYNCADVYLESFPVGSITAALEAGIHGIPMVGLIDKIPLIIQNDDISIKKANTHVCNLTAYEEEVEKLILNRDLRELRSSHIEKLILNDHVAEWKYHVTRLMRSLPSSHSINKPITRHSETSIGDLIWAYFQRRSGIDCNSLFS